MNTSYQRRRRATILMAGGLLIMAILIVLINKASSTTVASAQTINGGGNTPVACGKSVHYAAYDAPNGSGDFGPNQHFGSVADGMSRFNTKECSDPLFAAVQTEVLRHGHEISKAATMNLARRFVADRALWVRSVRAFHSQVVSMTLTSYDTSYETLGMIPGKNSHTMPQLIKASEQVELGQSLDVNLKDGRVIHERTACDLQYSVPRLPHVPTHGGTHHTPGHHPHPHPTCTPPWYSGKPGYSSGCHPHKLPQSWNCQQNGGPHCPPNHAHQPPQSVDPTLTQQPSTVPSHAPSQQPTRPVNTKHPAPPNSGGYNGGGTSNPVVSGSPVDGGGGTPTGTVAPPS